MARRPHHRHPSCFKHRQDQQRNVHAEFAFEVAQLGSGMVSIVTAGQFNFSQPMSPSLFRADARNQFARSGVCL